MQPRHRTTTQDLRTAVSCLPRDTRVAMLDGIARNPIIVGAYTDEGGICPMLAAHRAGGRTSAISFAHAWDRFAFRTAPRARRRRRPRRASERELLVLRAHLEASLLEDETPTAELAAARAEHEALVSRRAAERPRADAGPAVAADTARPDRVRPGDPDRSRELRRRLGWRWTRVVRTLDDYERVLRTLGAEGAPLERPGAPLDRADPEAQPHLTPA